VKRLHWVALGILVAAGTAATVLLWPGKPATQPVAYANISRNARICLASTSAGDAPEMWRAIQAETNREPVNAQHLISPNRQPDAIASFLNGVLALRCRLIVTTGSDMHDAVTATAKSHPDQPFASDDKSITQPNVRHVATAPEIAQLIRDVTNDH
jgi:basic membrane lipoprotein Med (substrate-binding protein (PBP1-ABC) superfamily)